MKTILSLLLTALPIFGQVSYQRPQPWATDTTGTNITYTTGNVAIGAGGNGYPLEIGGFHRQDLYSRSLVINDIMTNTSNGGYRYGLDITANTAANNAKQVYGVRIANPTFYGSGPFQKNVALQIVEQYAGAQNINLLFGNPPATGEYAIYSASTRDSLLSGTLTATMFLGPSKPLVNTHIPPTIYFTAGTEVNLYRCYTFYSADQSVLFSGVNSMDNIQALDECIRFSFALTNGLSTNVLACSWGKGLDSVSTSNITFIVSPTTAGNGTNRNVLLVGDSTMEGTITAELLRLFSTNNMHIVTQGTESLQTTNRWEGHSGWSYSTYATDAASPFRKAGVLDFASYLADNSITIGARDWVIFQLGINTIATQTTLVGATNAANTELSALRSICTNITATVPGVRIAVSIPYLGAGSQDGWGASYNSTSLCKQTSYPSQSVFISLLLQNYASYGVSAIVPVGLTIDPLYGYPSSSVARSAREATTVNRISNAFHPAAGGYYQSADTYFSFLKCMEP